MVQESNGSSGIWTFWPAAIRLISYCLKVKWNDLCLKAKGMIYALRPKE